MDHLSSGTSFRCFWIFIFFVVTTSSCSTWNQSTERFTASGHVTTQQLAEKGQILIFGEPEKGGKTVNIGKAQCPVCHAFQQERPSKRAPNLWGIASRRRIKPTPIDYLAESHVCPSCYIVAGWGLKGSQGCESPMPKVHLPPINLTLEELVAVDTWIYVHEGETPPSPDTIRSTYKNILSKEEWEYVTRDTRNRNETETSVKQLFLRHECTGCHIIPGVPGATVKLGPPLYMRTRAAARLKEPGYRGSASSPRDYIVESILYHDLYIVADKASYTNNTLSSSYYRNAISTSDLHQMVDYLETLEQDDQYQSSSATMVEKCLKNNDL